MVNYLLAVFCLIALDVSSQGLSSIYISPRYPAYGFGDNGVDRFRGDKKTVKRHSVYASYSIAQNQDSLNELFYLEIPDTIPWREFLVENEDTLTYGGPRIIVENSMGYSDRILIYQNLVVKIGDQHYLLNEIGFEFFIALMPADIKENWLDPMPRKFINPRRD